MRSSSSLLLLLLLFCGQFQETTASKLSDVLSNLTTAVRSKNIAKLSNLFESNFMFYGCNFNGYNKDRVIEILKELCEKTDSSKFYVALKANSPFKTVIVEGIGSAPFEAVLHVDHITGSKLTWGSTVECGPYEKHEDNSRKKRSLSQAMSQEDMKKITNDFVVKMMKAIGKRDKGLLNELFLPEYAHDTCGQHFDKMKFVKAFSQFDPQPSKNVSMSVDLVQDIGPSIRFVVALPEPGKDPILIDYYLNKKEQKLENGCALTCSQSPRNPNYRKSYPKSDVFMSSLSKAIATGDVFNIGILLSPYFEYNDCNTVFKKNEFAKMIAAKAKSIEMALKSEERVGSFMKYNVMLSGLEEKSVEVEMYLVFMEKFTPVVRAINVANCMHQ